MAVGRRGRQWQKRSHRRLPGYGVWIWMNNTAWVLLTSFDADQIVTADLDANGQD